MRSIRVMVSCLLIILGLSFTAAPASADEQPNPVTKVVQTVKKLVTPKKKVSTTVVAPSPSTDDDSPGHETTDPVAPDHASTRGLNTGILGTGVAGLNQDSATVNDDDSTSADSTLLSLGGQEVFGTHADSTGGPNEDSFNILAPLCVVSGGKVCVEALYSESTAFDDGTSSTATARSGLVSACLLGTETNPANGCDGPISVGAAGSENAIYRDQPSGRTQASAAYETLGTCVIVAEFCLNALGSFGLADSGGPAPGADRSSFVLFLGDEDVVDTPTDFSIPAGCPGLSILCMFLNQGETYLAPGIAGTAQDALQLKLLQILNLPGGNGLQLAVPVALVGIGHTETLVHNDGGEVIDPCLEDPQSCEPDPCLEDPESCEPNPCDEFSDEDCNGCDEHCDHGDDDDGDGRDKHRHHHHALPDTGGPDSGLLAIGLFGVAIGSAFVAAGRRERKVA
jgi:hypothetical protein